MRALLREPLLHFLAAAALVFAYFAWFAPRPDADNLIIIDRARLIAQWQSSWRRPPSQEELDNLVDDAIYSEIQIREALNMGLDEGDAVVRNRMLQKMRFLSDQSLAEPNEQMLEDWFSNNAERYAPEPRVTFQQVFLGQDISADRAKQTITVLQEGTSLDSPIEGAPLVGVPTNLQGVPQRSVDRQFGRGFTQAVLTIKPGVWQGPVESGYGWHAVKLTEIEPGAEPSLADPNVRRRVENDVLAERRLQERKKDLTRLKKRYRIEFAQ